MQEQKKSFFKNISEDMHSCVTIKNTDESTVVLEYNTAFEFSLNFLFFGGIIALAAMLYNNAFGPFLHNPMPYVLIALLAAGVKLIQSKSSFETVIDLSGSRLYFQNKFFSITKRTRAVPLSTISFVTIDGRPYNGRRSSVDYYIVLILNSGKIIKVSDAMPERYVNQNVETARNLASIMQVAFLEPELDHTIKIKSTPVVSTENLIYRSITEMRKKSFLAVLIVSAAVLIAAVLIAVILVSK